MGVHQITKGLDLPISGDPEQKVHDGPAISAVAIMAADSPFMKPRMDVKVGDEVKLGQLLFDDRKHEGVRFTSPGAGKVTAVNRGAKRAFQSVVIELNGSDDAVTFDAFKKGGVDKLGAGGVKDLMVESGMWTALRERPFGRVPAVTTVPHSIFVTAIDTHPLAPSVDVVLEGNDKHFETGLKALATLTEGSVFLCTAPGSKVPTPKVDRLKSESFAGPHPAGLAGTHIHLLDPVGRKKSVFYIGYQDVVALGHLVETGELRTERIVSLAGPGVSKPRLIRTRMGASTDDLVKGELKGDDPRVVAGSVLSGWSAMGDVHGYLGRYHNQVTVLQEDPSRKFMGWLTPGVKTFSVARAFLSTLTGGKFDFTTDTNGSLRAMVPIGMFEKVMPLDIMPTFFLRAIISDDIQRAEGLGILELDEDDLALWTFVAPGKEDFGVHLRRNLTDIWKEG